MTETNTAAHVVHGDEHDATQTAHEQEHGRRAFLRGAVGLGAGAVAATALLPTPAQANPDAGFRASGIRGAAALEHRIGRARSNLAGNYSISLDNGDETAASGYIGSFSKTLPHNDAGEVDPAAYRLFLGALYGGAQGDYAAIPLGGAGKLVSPQSAFAFQMDGADVARLTIPAAPAFNSELRASEMNEVYWMAVLRDVPFSQYAGNSLAQQAVTDLRRYPLWRQVNLTVDTLFRGITAGEKIGPYLSQFLYKTVPYGMTTIPQKYSAGTPKVDFMLTVAETVNIQRGRAPSQALVLDTTPHFMRNGRDLSEYVHRDFSYQAFLNAALILLGMGGAVVDDNNPYKASANQAGFVTLGGPDILTMVAQMGQMGLKAAWWQKWAIHRTLRPEVFALRVQQHVSGARNYPIHPAILSSPVLPELTATNNNVLLPMAYAEGSPAHPAYPAGHAAIAGACTTVLKAFFKESAVLADTVQPNDDGSQLTPYGERALTVGGELDKLAANIAIGRNIAGVHYWSDGIQGMLLGEKVALAYLADIRTTYAEVFPGFRLTKFDGTTVTI
jgi:membrane-associated phospholipid phosphatase